MKAIQYTWEGPASLYGSKSEWGPGAWHDEPDKMQFSDPETGLPCLIVRNGMGALCGYVGVADGHPLFGMPFERLPDLSVHGGITFCDFCRDGDEEHAICHLPEPGEPDRVYWLGFDCSHGFDIAPGMEAHYPSLFRNLMPRQYRTIAYVQAECATLAAQLAALEPGR